MKKYICNTIAHSGDNPPTFTVVKENKTKKPIQIMVNKTTEITVAPGDLVLKSDTGNEFGISRAEFEAVYVEV